MFSFLEQESVEVRDVLRRLASRTFRAAALGQRAVLDADATAEIEAAVRSELKREAKPNVD